MNRWRTHAPWDSPHPPSQEPPRTAGTPHVRAAEGLSRKYLGRGGTAPPQIGSKGSGHRGNPEAASDPTASQLALERLPQSLQARQDRDSCAVASQDAR